MDRCRSFAHSFVSMIVAIAVVSRSIDARTLSAASSCSPSSRMRRTFSSSGLSGRMIDSLRMCAVGPLARGGVLPLLLPEVVVGSVVLVVVVDDVGAAWASGDSMSTDATAIGAGRGPLTARAAAPRVRAGALVVDVVVVVEAVALALVLVLDAGEAGVKALVVRRLVSSAEVESVGSDGAASMAAISPWPLSRRMSSSVISGEASMSSSSTARMASSDAGSAMTKRGDAGECACVRERAMKRMNECARQQPTTNRDLSNVHK